MSAQQPDGPIKLYGAKISMFTGKVRSYLIKQGLPFTEFPASDPHFVDNIVPQIGRRIIPVIEMPDGTIVQDTTDIIDYLEAHFTPKISAYPSGALAHTLALIFELFGDMGLTRPAMHYRWNFPEQTTRFITHGFGGAMGPDASQSQRAGIDAAIAKFSGYLPMLGVTEATIPEIERRYIALLEVLDAHFSRHPYFLGARPSLADYGMMCSLYAHLGRDPVPAALMKNHAPNLYRWTERMNAPHDDISDMPYYKASGALPETLPETLSPILSHIGRYFMPQYSASKAVLDALAPQKSGERASLHPKFYVLGMVSFPFGDSSLTTAVTPMMFYMSARISDYVSQLNPVERAEITAFLRPFGLGDLTDPIGQNRVIRVNHTEVWA